MKLASNLELEAGVSILSWGHLKDNFTVPPEQIATIVSGAVYRYVWRGITRYRLVPEPYVSAGDAFYNEFSGGVLSGLIVARG